MTGNSPRLADPRGRGRLPRLYPILDIDLCRMRGLDPLALADALFAGGARLLQVRQKGAGTASFVAAASRIVEAARRVGAEVIVNDRADVALMAGADGVHVGQDDLPPASVRAIIGPGRWIGLSTHTRTQLDAARTAPIDYVAVGPVFRTATKDTGYEPRGLALVEAAARLGRPVVAIGGITLDNAAGVIAAGAASVAVISDLLTGGDPAERVRRFLAAESP